MDMRLEEALREARESRESRVVEVRYKLKKVFLYYTEGSLFHVKIETLGGEVITGKKALEKIMGFRDNYSEVVVRRVMGHELFKITAGGEAFEHKSPGYEQLKAFFFYITPQEVALLTHLAFMHDTLPAGQLTWREAIFDLWENRVVEFNGFLLHLPDSRGRLVRRLLVEHLRRRLRSRGRDEVEELKRGKLSQPLREFLREEGFLLLDRKLPGKLLEGIRDFEPPDREKLMEKYSIAKPDIEDIKKLLEE